MWGETKIKINKKINRIQFIKESAMCQKWNKIKNKYGHKKGGWCIEKKSSRNRKIDKERVLSKEKIFRWDVSYQIFSYSILTIFSSQTQTLAHFSAKNPLTIF